MTAFSLLREPRRTLIAICRDYKVFQLIICLIFLQIEFSRQIVYYLKYLICLKRIFFSKSNSVKVYRDYSSDGLIMARCDFFSKKCDECIMV